MRQCVSHRETPLPGTEYSFNVLRMPHRHVSAHAAIELALIGVSVQSVADIDCR